MLSKVNASRTATGEISRMPLNGEYMTTMMKTAPDAARAHTISVTITVALDGATRLAAVTAVPLLPLGLTVFLSNNC